MAGNSVGEAGKGRRVAAAATAGGAGGGTAGEAIGRAASSGSSSVAASQGTESTIGVTIMHPEFAAIGAALLGLVLVIIVVREE